MKLHILSNLKTQEARNCAFDLGENTVNFAKFQQFFFTSLCILNNTCKEVE